MATRLKKIAISLLMTVITAIINDNPQSGGIMLIGFYIISSIFQFIAIEDDRPKYRKVFKHNLWLTAIFVAFFICYLISFPHVSTQKFGMDFTNIGLVIFFAIWGYIVGYITNAITGVLTVFWLTRGKQKQQLGS